MVYDESKMFRGRYRPCELRDGGALEPYMTKTGELDSPSNGVGLGLGKGLISFEADRIGQRLQTVFVAALL